MPPSPAPSADRRRVSLIAYTVTARVNPTTPPRRIEHPLGDPARMLDEVPAGAAAARPYSCLITSSPPPRHRRWGQKKGHRHAACASMASYVSLQPAALPGTSVINPKGN
jgi:hypothetical protein